MDYYNQNSSKLFIARLCQAASTVIPPGVRPSTSLALAGLWPACCMILPAPARAVADGWASSMAGAGKTLPKSNKLNSSICGAALVISPWQQLRGLRIEKKGLNNTG